MVYMGNLREWSRYLQVSAFLLDGNNFCIFNLFYYSGSTGCSLTRCLLDITRDEILFAVFKENCQLLSMNCNFQAERLQFYGSTTVTKLLVTQRWRSGDRMLSRQMKNGFSFNFWEKKVINIIAAKNKSMTGAHWKGFIYLFIYFLFSVSSSYSVSAKISPLPDLRKSNFKSLEVLMSFLIAVLERKGIDMQ